MAASSKSEIVQKAVEIVEEYGSDKMTLRQLYYQLVARLVIPNNQSQYKRLSALLVEAREDGVLDWDALEDRTRHILGAPSIGDGTSAEEEVESILRTVEYYQGPSLPAWWGQENYVEVWLEKQALEGVFESVTSDLSVVLMPGKGYSSATFLKDAAQRLEEVRDEGRHIHIIYFGDWDPSGLDIERYAQEKLAMHGIEVDSFTRAGLTQEQISQYNLPPMPVKEADSRASQFRVAHGDDVVELDALPINILKKVIKDSILAFFDGQVNLRRRVELGKRRAEYKTQLKTALIQYVERLGEEDLSHEEDGDQDQED